MNIETLINNYTLENYWLINNRYAIYRDGIIYDTKKASDIPTSIFKIRDNLIKQNSIIKSIH